ncbi:MAG: glycoside hydrolase family 88 protein [Prevotellaceae bacterium]|nr:glycoside hydrolase family 88 protein [Prevotellaceae bacterium]
MNSRILILITLALASVTATAEADDYTFRLKNASGIAREGETVEISMPERTKLSASALMDEEGEAIPFEAVGDTLLRFQASIPYASTKGYTLKDGTPTSPAKLTYATIKEPSSRGDIAWENDRTAYRMYSSVLLKSEPATGNGVDLWQKKQAEPIIDAMYSLSNYHSESQYGVDAFNVNGLRLGDGGVSHVVDGKLVVHDPHDECTVVENGALKSEFVVTYNNVEVDGDTYTKTVRVIATAGSLLNKAIVRYEGTVKPMRLAVALYQHTDIDGLSPDGVAYTSTPGLAGWAENPSEGTVTSSGARFYQGAYVPSCATEAEVIDDHLCLTVDYTPGTDLVYYFGGGWNMFPAEEYTQDEDWFLALERFKETVDSPIALTTMETIPQRNDVMDLIYKVNNYWQTQNPTHGDHFWNRAVYHIGNMAAHGVTDDEDFLDYSLAWAEQNNYCGATGTDKSRWKYTYGETADYVLFGDNQVCFQVYADLYNLLGGEEKIERAREVMEYEMSTSFSGYLWWVDGLFMVMPIMTKLYNITGNQQYLEKMHEYWRWGTDLMWDDDESLYYRDSTYIYPRHQTDTGGKDFWARGDGWIFAAFARVLDELPEDDAYRDEYISYYLRMAEALRKCQVDDGEGNGYWCRSLLEESYAPGYETSGTALFTYGFLWGINHGLLDEQTYGETVQKAWNYLTGVALQSDGLVGYVQPIGSDAAPDTYMTATQTADFGVGAYLLAASEMSRYAAPSQEETPLRLTSVTLVDDDVVSVKFKEQVEPEAAAVASNYLLDGEPIDGAAEYDGERTVTLALKKPVDFGQHSVTVTGQRSLGGSVLTDSVRTILRTVPLYDNVTIAAVTAIGAQSGNPATSTIDNNLDTRWSQEGTGQWLQLDLGSSQTVYALDIAFYLGDTRVNYFDVSTSDDAQEWTRRLSDQQSSGMSAELERYYLPEEAAARYVRIYCNQASTTTWNSITEARVCVVENSFDELQLPELIYSDILLPAATEGGTVLTWATSDASVLSRDGKAALTDEEQQVTLTAIAGKQEREFNLTLMPRDVEANLQLRYDFETGDVYTDGSQRMLKDHSAHRRDAKLINTRCTIDGTLNLTDNTASGWNTNGYVLIPEHLLDSLRSYTIVLTATPKSLTNLPRFYDFGSGSTNSMFLRAGDFAAGYKYKGGDTALLTADALQTGVEQNIAVTYSVLTGLTTIYVDGEVAAQSADIEHEPYELAAYATDSKNFLGRTQWYNTSAKSSNVDYSGTMDNFRVYSLCLTAEEIEALFEEMATGIKAATETATRNSATYDLSGRRTRKDAKGVVIENGKKILK